jgi:NAD(P)-dependent dehydrogenase (short-subunit alcohol dehydrogenase family)/putative sterol carrier protein
MNRGVFAGKTVFVTGSSRGIGKAIALKFAKDGANVVVAAKTVEPHPKLEGTIHTTAKEVEQVGGKSLAVQLDLRDEETIKNAINQTIEKFGRLDLLVNNASAIFIAQSVDTPMKRFDLMNSINVRGTFMMSKYAIPHLVKSNNPHIINLSPPIELKDQWFSPNTAYTMSKYGMSLSAFGLAAELRGVVGVNALWPKTAIWTAAMNMLGGDEARKGSRKPSIMADAAYAIACKDKSVSGNFFIDEELLKEEGVQDFDQYAEVPGHPLLPDFFLPDRVLKDFDPVLLESLTKKVSDAQRTTTATTDSPRAGDDGPVAAVFAAASGAITDEIKDDLNATLHFQISDKHWTMISKKGSPLEIKGDKPEQKADVLLITDDTTFIKMSKGEVKPTSAFMGGKLKVKGNMGLALKVEKLFGKLKGKL